MVTGSNSYHASYSETRSSEPKSSAVKISPVISLTILLALESTITLLYIPSFDNTLAFQPMGGQMQNTSALSKANGIMTNSSSQKGLEFFLNLSNDEVSNGDTQSFVSYTLDKSTNEMLDYSVIDVSVVDPGGNIINQYSGRGNVSGVWTIDSNVGGIFEVTANASANGYKPIYRETSYLVSSDQPQNTSSCKRIQPIGAFSSSFEEDPNDYHPPLDAIDADMQSWWSSQGVPTWLQIELDEQVRLCSIEIIWNKGDEREYDFSILGSIDGEKFDNLYSGKSKKTLDPEKYEMDDQSISSVKILVEGSSSGKGWVSIREVNILGS